jgi:hypothetical protein
MHTKRLRQEKVINATRVRHRLSDDFSLNARLFPNFSPGRLVRHLTGDEVPTRWQPQAYPLVMDKQDMSTSDHQAAGREMISQMAMIGKACFLKVEGHS